MSGKIRFNEGYVGQREVNERLGETLFNDNAHQYDPEQYQFDKITGKRTSKRTPLKRLKAYHRNIIALHLRGMSNRDISTITGINESNISGIINDKLSQEIIQNYIEGVDRELEALAPMAVDAIRGALGSNDANVQLKAADKFFKATGRYAKAEKGGDSAEDVLARALARVAQENASTLREVTRSPSAQLIDGTMRDVTDEGDNAYDETDERG